VSPENPPGESCLLAAQTEHPEQGHEAEGEAGRAAANADAAAGKVYLTRIVYTPHCETHRALSGGLKGLFDRTDVPRGNFIIATGLLPRPIASGRTPTKRKEETPAMRNWCSLAIIVAIPILPAGLKLPSVAAQEPSMPRLPGVASPSPGYSPTLQEDGPRDNGSPGSYSSFPQGAEAAASETWDIQRRLQRLELQNAELVRQNEQLRDSLATGPGGHRVTQTTRGGVVLVSAAEPPADPAEVQPSGIAAGMLELKSGMEKLGAGVERIGENLTVTTAHKECDFKLALFGAISGEMILADARPLIPSAVAMVSPDFGRDTQIAELSARSSYLGAAAVGPSVGDFQSGGLVLAYFYSSSILDDNYGFFIARAYGELKNDCWRFSVGLDGDVINPLNPEMIDWSPAFGAGNLGFLRAQFRMERYFYPSDESKVTAQFALSNPIPTNYENFSVTEGLTESNGWPNVEGRLALGFGRLVEREGTCVRAHEVGVSGLVGQLRRTGDLLTPNMIADVWAIGADARFAITDRLGVKGEFYHGQTVGTYMGAAIQNFNANREGIRSTGGWAEVYYYWTPSLHSHFGGGVDNPLEADLTAGKIRRNQFCFGNILWDVTKSIDVGFEVSRWETAYMAPLHDNQAMVYDTRVRVKF